MGKTQTAPMSESGASQPLRQHQTTRPCRTSHGTVCIRSGNLQLQKVLGKGANGTVYLGVREDSRTFAVKVVKLTSHGTLNELRIGRLLSLPQHFSPNIVTLSDHTLQDGYLYYVMELCRGGELFNYVIEKGLLEQKRARDYCRQIAEGLSTAHLAGVAHRDLKLENVLLSGDLATVKISDFGLSTMTNLAQPGCLQFTKCGSLAYAAPELIRGEGYCPFRADIWSLGICMTTLLFSRFPFDMASDKASAFQTYLAAHKAGSHTILDELGASRPDCASALDLLKACLHPDPAERITLTDILQHPWLAGDKQRTKPAGEGPTESGTWVRQLGWALPACSKHQFCGHLKTVLNLRGLHFEQLQSQFTIGQQREIKCSVTEHNNTVCVQWERNRASPLEMREVYQQVREGLEERLGPMPAIFSEGLPTGCESSSQSEPDSSRSTSPTSMLALTRPNEVSAPGTIEQSNSPKNQSLSGRSSCSNKRKTFEGMADDSGKAPKLGFNFTLARSAPALRRSSSHLDLNNAELEEYGAYHEV